MLAIYLHAKTGMTVVGEFHCNGEFGQSPVRGCQVPAIGSDEIFSYPERIRQKCELTAQ